MPLIITDNPLSRMLIDLWCGKFSLAMSFWVFFIAGPAVVAIGAAFVSVITGIGIILPAVYLAYLFIAATGIFKSAQGVWAVPAKIITALILLGDITRIFHY